MKKGKCTYLREDEIRDSVHEMEEFGTLVWELEPGY